MLTGRTGGCLPRTVMAPLWPAGGCRRLRTPWLRRLCGLHAELQYARAWLPLQPLNIVCGDRAVEALEGEIAGGLGLHQVFYGPKEAAGD